MVLHVLRGLFVLLMAAIGWFYLTNPKNLGGPTWIVMPIMLALGILFISIDILSPRRKLAVFSGAILGLVVGLSISYAMSFVVSLVVDQIPIDINHFTAERHDLLIRLLNVTVGTICCYFAISFILQTRDDFRFIIPYVEFSREQKGPRSMLLDTSVLIDGRIVDIAGTGMIESPLIVPSFVVDELQALADSADKLKRARGRRGLDMVAKLRANKSIETKIYQDPHLEGLDATVDQKLLRLGKELNGRVVTTDYNLNKVAQVGGVDVININDLAAALKAVVLPGEKLAVKIIRAGEEPGQGVGYLEDGTMVVVEQARERLNQEVELVVSRALQTSAGRMIFGRVATEVPVEAPNPHRRQRSQSGATSESA